jgi:hypothetical protein
LFCQQEVQVVVLFFSSFCGYVVSVMSQTMMFSVAAMKPQTKIVQHAFAIHNQVDKNDNQEDGH